MGSISSGVGLISGINSSQIIDQLIALDARPARQLQTRIDNNKNIKVAYADLQARLSSLLNTSNLLIRPSTFQSATGTSSDTNTLGVTVAPTAQAGQYQFTVARTVTSQSSISSGFTDTTSLVGAGSIKIGLGGGEVTSSPNLSDLNAGAGVRRGQFRITDRSGQSANIDIGSALNLDDVIKKINTASNIQIRASVGPNGLVLKDASGGAGSLKVEDLSGGNAAADLGIRSTVAADTLTGTDINKIGRGTLLSALNDGLGVRSKPGTDLRITTADGSTKDISLNGKRTVGDVIDAINTVAGGKYVASLRDDGKGLKISDSTVGGGSLSVTALSGSNAVADLGLGGADVNGTVTGGSLISGLGSVLLKTLKGGAGVTGTQIALTDRAGGQATLDLSGASSLSDVITAINNAGTGLTASVNRSGTGISLTDNTTGTGDINVSGDLATSLGIAGTVTGGKTTVEGGPLNRQFVGENTLLSTLAGGKGISLGKFRITNSLGVSAEADLTGVTSGRIGDVLSIINAKGLGVTASINSDGTGIQLTDTNVGGSVKLKVEEVSGTSARDLNILGTATTNTITGSFGATLAITATDTLAGVVSKINAAGVGLVASIVNDGTAGSPYRLSLSAANPGQNGRFTFDAGTTGLGVDTLVSAQNAAVFLGGANAVNPILITSSTNTINNVAPGVTLNLLTASDRPVSVSVAQTSDGAVSQVQGFVKTFNDLSGRIATLTSFDTTTNARGLLLGDATTRAIGDNLFGAINTAVAGAGRYSLFSQIGLTVGEDNQLRFDEDKFRAAYATDPTSVQRLFTAYNTVKTTTTTSTGGVKLSETVDRTPFGTETAGSTTTKDASNNTVVTTIKTEGFGLGYKLQEALNKLIDPVNGSLTNQNKNIDTANELFTDRIGSINTLLTAKKARLQKQFANLETVLAQLQTQQSAIGRISSSSASTSAAR